MGHSHRCWLRPLLPTETHRHGRIRDPAALDRDGQKLANPLVVQYPERVVSQQAEVPVLGHEGSRIVPRQAKGKLGQVVGAKGEEVTALGDFLGAQASTRRLDHRADADGLARVVGHDGLKTIAQDLHFTGRRNQRQHDIDPRLHPLLPRLPASGDERADLRLVDLREHDPKTAPPQPHHGVGFAQGFEAALNPQQAQACDLGQLFDLSALGRQKLVQRRVEQAHGHRLAFEHQQQAQELGLHQRFELLQHRFPGLNRFGEDHLLHAAQPLSVEEHVLRPAKADAFGTKVQGGFDLGHGFCVGQDFQAADRVTPGHDLIKGFGQVRLLRLHPARQNAARGAVDGDPVTFVEQLFTDLERAGFRVDIEFAHAHDARFTQASGDHCRVAGHAARARQNACCHRDGADVFRGGFTADQQNRSRAAGLSHVDGVTRREIDAPGDRARRGVDAHSNGLALTARCQARVQHFFEVQSRDQAKHVLTLRRPGFDHVYQRRKLGAGCQVEGLNVEDLAVRDGELERSAKSLLRRGRHVATGGFTGCRVAGVDLDEGCGRGFLDDPADVVFAHQTDHAGAL